jgi:hypothetical protein
MIIVMTEQFPENLSVQRLLLCEGNIMTTRFVFNFVKFDIRYGKFCMGLDSCDPRVSNRITHPILLAPQNFIREVPILERLAKIILFNSILGSLERLVHNHTRLDNTDIQKWNPEFEAVGCDEPIGPKSIKLVNQLETPSILR